MSRNILVPDQPAESPSEDPTEDLEALNSEEESAPDEAPEASPIPDKYQGKSIEEIIAMHQNAEKEIGRQANEVGTYRELVQTLSEAKRTTDLSQAGTTEVKPVEVTADDLYDNPTQAIRQVVEDVVSKALNPIQQQQQAVALDADVQKLLSDYPDAEQIGADPAFVEFVENSEYRMRDAQRWVDTRDTDAARRLLSDFKDYSSIMQGRRKATTDPTIERAKKVATESGKGSSPEAGSKKTLSKAEVAKVFIKDREKYDSPAYQAMLVKHAREGTLVD